MPISYMNHNSRIDLRLSKEDKQKIQDLALAANVSVSRYLLLKGLGHEIKPSLVNPLKEILEQINRWGNNLNQIAKGINQARLEENLQLYQQTLREISVIKTKISEIQAAVAIALDEVKGQGSGVRGVKSEISS